MIVYDLREAIRSAEWPFPAAGRTMREALGDPPVTYREPVNALHDARDAVLAFLCSPLPSRYFCLDFGCVSLAVIRRHGTSADTRRDFYGWCSRHGKEDRP